MQDPQMSEPSHAPDEWSLADVPELLGRTAVVTGATGGIGLETAKALAGKGAVVILACRDVSKAERVADVLRQTGHSSIHVVELDLGVLALVHQAAQAIRSTFAHVDLLINNAGVMTVPYRRTVDGFESTFAINHLGPFAFTGLLLDRLIATPGSRIVTVSSVAHRRGVMRFDDLQLDSGYKPGLAYDQSKLANLLFTYELERRLRTAEARTMALAAHPGIARTDLWRTSSLAERVLLQRGLRGLTSRLAQSAEDGALPVLRAALDPTARGGDYFGPSRPSEYTGLPVRVESSAASHDVAAQKELWDVSEQLTQVSYQFEPAIPG
jgi:NAD(P)-dependent dehydrogenase (short-subunit alcohol dehydrogenase family)